MVLNFHDESALDICDFFVVYKAILNYWGVMVFN